MSQNVILSDRPADDQQKVLCFMEAEFISSGYMYNGCIEASAANSERVGMPWENFNRALFLLAQRGLINKRDCQADAFELSPARMTELIEKHNLLSVWYDDPPHPYRTRICLRCFTAVHEDDLSDGRCPACLELDS